jgi:hypothetical protein
MSKLVHNEQMKLRATYLNAVAAGGLLVSAFVPQLRDLVGHTR